jgi:hypothetical protein
VRASGSAHAAGAAAPPDDPARPLAAGGRLTNNLPPYPPQPYDPPDNADTLDGFDRDGKRLYAIGACALVLA